MPNNFHFQKQILDCVVGGVSALDIPRLDIHELQQARAFIEAYGYNWEAEADREELWSMHRRAVALIKDQLLEEGERIPEALFDPAKITDLGQLLIYASSRRPEDRELQRWSCAILRVMHVFVHLRNDLFSAFNDEIQNQILKPLQDAIVSDPVAGSISLGSPSGGDRALAGEASGRRAGGADGIRLHRFDIKPFKTTASAVIKLLARPERVALTLLDKLGVRFVTRSVFDSFRVIRFLIEKSIVSYPHIIPDQSNNTLYPLNIFLEAMDELKALSPPREPEEIEALLVGRLEAAGGRAEFRQKANAFSGADYKFVKFINRKLITVSLGQGERQRPFRFFYPYEIQVMDYDTHVRNLFGPMAHDAYKDRQRRRARERVLREAE
jgi:uncharacterized protein (TIGR04562 family)